MYSAMIFSVVSERLRLTRSVREAMAGGGSGATGRHTGWEGPKEEDEEEVVWDEGGYILATTKDKDGKQVAVQPARPLRV